MRLHLVNIGGRALRVEVGKGLTIIGDVTRDLQRSKHALIVITLDDTLIVLAQSLHGAAYQMTDATLAESVCCQQGSTYIQPGILLVLSSQGSQKGSFACNEIIRPHH